MASLLINARPFTGRHDIPKGGAVGVRSTSDDFGLKEQLPKFIRLHCEPALLSDVNMYMAAWAPQLVVIELPAYVDLVADTHRYSVTHDAVSSTAQEVDYGKLQRTIIEPLLAQWDATVLSAANGVIEFELGIRALVSCPAVLDWPQSVVDAVVFDEVNYDQGTGLHVIDIDYSATNKGPTAIETQAMGNAQVLAHSTAEKVIRIAVPRDIAKASFIEALQNYYRTVSALYRCRYYLPETLVDQIIAEGGERIYATLAELQSEFIDRLA